MLTSYYLAVTLGYTKSRQICVIYTHNPRGAPLDMAWRSAVAILLVLPAPRFLHVSRGQN